MTSRSHERSRTIVSSDETCSQRSDLNDRRLRPASHASTDASVELSSSSSASASSSSSSAAAAATTTMAASGMNIPRMRRRRKEHSTITPKSSRPPTLSEGNSKFHHRKPRPLCFCGTIACVAWLALIIFASTRSATLRKGIRSGVVRSFLPRPRNYTCSQLFDAQQLRYNAAMQCLEHSAMQWVACAMGDVAIDDAQLYGPVGGESIASVAGRSVEEENLYMEPGSLLLPDTAVARRQVSNILNFAITGSLLEFLQSRQYVAPDDIDGSVSVAPRIMHVIVKRGDYANPCMAMISIYNTWLTLQHLPTVPDLSKVQIVWLDGHAQGAMDSVWTTLFGNEPLHIKQMFQRAKTSAAERQAGDSAHNTLVQLRNAIIVNDQSIFQDRFMAHYNWREDSNDSNDADAQENQDHIAATATNPDAIDTATTSRRCGPDSTLLAFRNFVLQRYNQLPTSDSTARPLLTLLIRKNYKAHPRSDGRTDRTLTNVSQDVEYLQSQYATHDIEVVAFEGLPFEQQLRQMVRTDIFVAVHGAGNIHVLFLVKPGARFVEYVPKQFETRKRFRFIAECLDVPYLALPAPIDEVYAHQRISVRLKPTAD